MLIIRSTKLNLACMRRLENQREPSHMVEDLTRGNNRVAGVKSWLLGDLVCCPLSLTNEVS